MGWHLSDWLSVCLQVCSWFILMGASVWSCNLHPLKFCSTQMPTSLWSVNMNLCLCRYLSVSLGVFRCLSVVVPVCFCRCVQVLVCLCRCAQAGVRLHGGYLKIFWWMELTWTIRGPAVSCSSLKSPGRILGDTHVRRHHPIRAKWSTSSSLVKVTMIFILYQSYLSHL